MIDIHTHILNDFDDGADSEDVMLKMCSDALEAGTSAIVATPHFLEGNYERASKDRVYKEVRKLNRLLAKKKIGITIYPGCEAFISWELPDFVQDGKCATINGSQYLLVELPMGSIPLYAEEVFYELQLQGITPILAHPERYSEIINNPKLINSFTEKGILVQLNSGSITGRLGKRVQETAWALLHNRAVHFVASDAHSMRSRKPRLNHAYDIVKKNFGQENADLLFKKNADNIINNHPVEEMVSRKFMSMFIQKILTAWT